jgi:hypothetical protein
MWWFEPCLSIESWLFWPRCPATFDHYTTDSSEHVRRVTFQFSQVRGLHQNRPKLDGDCCDGRRRRHQPTPIWSTHLTVHFGCTFDLPKLLISDVAYLYPGLEVSWT